MPGALGNGILCAQKRREERSRVEGRSASRALAKRHSPHAYTAYTCKIEGTTRIDWNEITHAIWELNIQLVSEDDILKTQFAYATDCVLKNPKYYEIYFKIIKKNKQTSSLSTIHVKDTTACIHTRSRAHARAHPARARTLK